MDKVFLKTRVHIVSWYSLSHIRVVAGCCRNDINPSQSSEPVPISLPLILMVFDIQWTDGSVIRNCRFHFTYTARPGLRSVLDEDFAS